MKMMHIRVLACEKGKGIKTSNEANGRQRGLPFSVLGQYDPKTCLISILAI